MNAQDLLDSTDRDELLPQDLWDMVGVPHHEPPTPTMPARGSSPLGLEVVDLAEPAAAQGHHPVTELARSFWWASIITFTLGIISLVGMLYADRSLSLLFGFVAVGMLSGASTCLVCSYHIRTLTT